MNDNKVNPYSTPESDLSVDDNSARGVENFKRFSAWGVFGLTMITFGIYPLYWLVNRGKLINTFHDNKIPNLVLNGFVVSVVGYFVLSIIATTSQNGFLLMLTGLCALAYMITYLWMLFAERSRLKVILDRSINPILTLFGTAIYFQYKINQTLDGK